MKWRNKKGGLVFFIVLIALGGLVLGLNFFCGAQLKNFYRLSLYEQCFPKLPRGALFSEDYEEVLTKSGLKVLFLKDQSLPSVQYQIFFPIAGADYDLDDKGGLSALTAHLLEQGAGELNSEALQEELNQLGTSLSIWVSRQTVNISLSGLSWHGDKLWALFQKIIAQPHFQDKEMEILRRQFLDKRSMKLDRPGSVAHAEWRKMLFPGSAGMDQGGTLMSLSKISLQDVKSFYKSQYLEGGAVLMVVGKYDQKLKEGILDFFNDHFVGEAPIRRDFFAASDSKPKSQLLTNEELVQTEIVMGYSLEAFPTKNPKKFLIQQLANTVLGGGGMADRLFTELREKRGLTYSTYSNLDFGKYYGLFSVAGSTKTESVKEFLEQTLVVLKTFREKGISPEELARAKQYLKIRYLGNIETPEDWLNRKVYYTDYLGVADDFLDNYVNILESLSLDEVNQAIPDFVLSKPLQVLIYGHPSIESQLKGLEGYPPAEVVSFKNHFAEELKFRQTK